MLLMFSLALRELGLCIEKDDKATSAAPGSRAGSRSKQALVAAGLAASVLMFV